MGRTDAVAYAPSAPSRHLPLLRKGRKSPGIPSIAIDFQ